jgi:uncharacterized OsmC-like protein
MGDLASALRRIQRVLRKSPQTGLHADAVATAHWAGGAKVVCSHSNGTTVATDLGVQLGGDGTGVTPGWLLRAGLASCAATTIAAIAATEGIGLTTLEIAASSRSDTRGWLEMTDSDGRHISAGPQDVQLHVRISAGDGTPPERLRELVARAHSCAPVSRAIEAATPVELHIEA